MSIATGTYSRADLERLWIQAGGSPANARLAAAVALAESSGVPGALNHNTNGTVDRGLWQINSIHGALSTTDPLANARAAVKISNGGSNWQPWVTFNTGAFRRFLSGASPIPAPAVAGTSPGAAATDGGGGGGLFDPIVKAIPKVLLYVALIVGGAALVAIGLHRTIGGAS